MRILLIEDYPPLQKSLSKGLREAGFAVDVTGDGNEGLWYATGNTYDVILLDIMLPGMDGLSLLKKLREQGNQTNVLVLTAKSELEDRVNGLDLGADDYLVKPFEYEELLARIRVLVRREYSDKSPVLEIGKLKIETAAQRVWRGKTEIELTAREYTLLEYLARRTGQTVSRSDIWEHLYEFNSDASSNVVDVYVGYLRRKLDKPGKESMIRTVRGRGYVMGAGS